MFSIELLFDELDTLSRGRPVFLPRRGYCVEQLKSVVRPLSVCPSVCWNHFLSQKSAASRAVMDVSWVQKRSQMDQITKNNPKKRSFTGGNGCFVDQILITKLHKSPFGATLPCRCYLVEILCSVVLLSKSHFLQTMHRQKMTFLYFLWNANFVIFWRLECKRSPKKRHELSHVS